MPKDSAPRITLYSKSDCHLCDIAKERIENVRRQTHFELNIVDITTDPDLFEKYQERIPVVFINNKEAYVYRVSEKGLLKKLGAQKPWWKRLLGR
jgi:glutaredoxin